MKLWKSDYNYDYYTELALGIIPKRSSYNKYGVNPSATADEESSIWDYPDEDMYNYQLSPVEHFVSSSSALDNQVVIIEGLNELYQFESKQFTLNGQVKTSVGIWYRTFRVYNNNGLDLNGNIYVYEDDTITGGIPDNSEKVRAYVDINEQQTRMLVYTVPDKHLVIITDLSTGLAKKQDTAAKFRLKIREFEKVWRTIIPWGMGSNGPPFAFSPKIKGIIPPKTDIEITVETSSIGLEVSAYMGMELIKL